MNQPPNFSRRMVKDFTETLRTKRIARTGRALTQAQAQEAEAALRAYLDVARRSVKFMLPQGGYSTDDNQLRALESDQPLRLPFPHIALEFHCLPPADPRVVAEGRRTGQQFAVATIIFAEEGVAESGRISVLTAHRFLGWPVWVPGIAFTIPTTGFADNKSSAKGPVRIRIGRGWDPVDPSRPEVPYLDYSGEASVLLSFLNALQCVNVRIESLQPRRVGKPGKALPFDTYHVLTIPTTKATAGDSDATGGHRSPREHLRRGHVRRLFNGRRIWVNAAIVNPGIGAKVEKDYRLRSSQGGCQ